MKWENGEENTDISLTEKGLFILCEGNFQYGNASLSFYEPSVNLAENNLFYRANGMKLGDVAQSMTIHDSQGWIVVNNSHIIFAINTDNLKETGRIEGFTSPRYIHFVNDEKAFVSQLWDNRIFVINPKKFEITGFIEVPGMQMGSGSTEQMVSYGKYVFCSCWSYQNKIIKIDTESDMVVGELQVGIQPMSMVLDRNNKLWVITDGGYEGSPYGYESPALTCIDAERFKIEKRLEFKMGENPRELNLNNERDCLYWINGDIWKMEVNSDGFPQYPVIKNKATKFYALTVSPENGDLYVADAIDYMQPGIVYRYSQDSDYISEFYVGVNPGAFCWKK